MRFGRISRRVFRKERPGGKRWSAKRLAGLGAALLSALLMVLLGTGVLKVPLLTNAVGAVFTPVQRAINNGLNDLKSRSRQRAYAAQLETAYNQLLAQHGLLEEELGRMQQVQEENERLQALLGYEESSPEKTFLLAYVSGMEPSQWFCEFTINRGSADGVETGAAVYTADGLIGRVIGTADRFSTVMSLVDSRSAVACIVKRTRDNGVVKGNAGALTEGLCRMLYLPADSEVAIGDEVYTSGLDGVYPEGLLVGTVASLSREENSESTYVLIGVQADYTHIEEVLVQVNAP